MIESGVFICKKRHKINVFSKELLFRYRKFAKRAPELSISVGFDRIFTDKTLKIVLLICKSVRRTIRRSVREQIPRTGSGNKFTVQPKLKHDSEGKYSTKRKPGSKQEHDTKERR